MRKSNALTPVLAASAILCFCGATVKNNDTTSSMMQSIAQERSADRKITPRLTFPIALLEQEGRAYPGEFLPGRMDPLSIARSDFSQRLEGGILRQFEFGLIVVEPAAQPGSLQPTALTTDAIITSSVRSKIAGQPHLPSGGFEVQTDAGIVTIHSKGESLEQAAEVINLALCVPDVRQIVYTMPSNVWRGIVSA